VLPVADKVLLELDIALERVELLKRVDELEVSELLLMLELLFVEVVAEETLR
jgi:hypothetical protein